jgi:hypothetical protein
MQHGIPGEDIRHATDNTVAVEEVGDDPVRWLVLGPGRAGNLPELVMDHPAGSAVIHAMPMRDAYQRLLPKAGENRHEPRTPQGRHTGNDARR